VCLICVGRYSVSDMCGEVQCVWYVWGGTVCLICVGRYSVSDMCGEVQCV